MVRGAPPWRTDFTWMSAGITPCADTCVWRVKKIILHVPFGSREVEGLKARRGKREGTQGNQSSQTENKSDNIYVRILYITNSDHRELQSKM